MKNKKNPKDAILGLNVQAELQVQWRIPPTCCRQLVRGACGDAVDLPVAHCRWYRTRV